MLFACSISPGTCDGLTLFAPSPAYGWDPLRTGLPLDVIGKARHETQNKQGQPDSERREND
jgi:hypothetical protein